MKQVWELTIREGGWISAAEIYRSRSGRYAVQMSAILADTRGGINQIYIWRARDGYHGRLYQKWDFERMDSIMPEDVIPLESFNLDQE